MANRTDKTTGPGQRGPAYGHCIPAESLYKACFRSILAGS
jgi:hypothetical protein